MDPQLCRGGFDEKDGGRERITSRFAESCFDKDCVDSHAMQISSAETDHPRANCESSFCIVENLTKNKAALR